MTRNWQHPRLTVVKKKSAITVAQTNRERPRWELKMSVLSKSRHELFSQAVANGRSLDDAYSDAGFVRNRGNASKLMRNTAIQSRVDELLQERAS
ncbi:MAG: hypothetical protein WA712_18310, partial [Pseudolabrys sp.]